MPTGIPIATPKSEIAVSVRPLSGPNLRTHASCLSVFRGQPFLSALCASH